ncbi:MAG: DUF6916 family protein [Blastocatellia bacterium]
MLDALHYEDFLPHIGSKFKAPITNELTVEFELTSVVNKPPSPKQEQFILNFRLPKSYPIRHVQFMFTLHHEQLGSGVIFLVPIEQQADSVIYEAVFNRPIED